jgi:cytochrome c peroxidase
MRTPWLLLGISWALVLLAAIGLLCATGARAPGASGGAEGLRAELGRQLFYDRRLSGDGRSACASCHRQEHGFGDGRPTARAADGAALPRNTPGLLNMDALPAYGWANPGAQELRAQVARPLFATHPAEMGVAGNEALVLARLRADGAYRAGFAAAFPGDADPLRWGRVLDALAAFTASLVARDTPYDRYLASADSAALSGAALRGMELFFSPGLACAHCHSDVARPGAPPRPAQAAYLANGAGRSADRGLAEANGRRADAYRFRVPPLRNVALTAPYMHDGSLASLEAVLRFYESGGRRGAGPEPERAAARHPLVAGFALSDRERQDLIAFLQALSDRSALHNPVFADPALASPSAASSPPRLPTRNAP